MFFNFCGVTQSNLECHMQVRFHVLHMSNISCVAHEPYFTCCMLIRSTQVRFCVLQVSKTLCAACESAFQCAVCKLTTILSQIRTKAYNEMACKQNMLECVDTQKIALCQVYVYLYSNLWMTLYCTTSITKHDNDTRFR